VTGSLSREPGGRDGRALGWAGANPVAAPGVAEQKLRAIARAAEVLRRG